LRTDEPWHGESAFLVHEVLYRPRSVELKSSDGLVVDRAAEYARWTRTRGSSMKGSEKPKKGSKKVAQKSLKEKRNEKRAKKKAGGGLSV
jgi:hypothetical protein